MSQSTIVIKLPPQAQRLFRDSLEGASYEFQSVPHAQLSVRSEGVVATLYDSGKGDSFGPLVVCALRVPRELRAEREPAGPPTDAAGLEFLRLHGLAQLPKVAKLHFKNTPKILAAHDA